MSHTGNVLKKQQSPGCIYVNSIGYAIVETNGQSSLIFSRPPGNARRNPGDHFIAFFSPDGKSFEEDDYVTYNLVRRDSSISGLDENEIVELEKEVAEDYNLRGDFKFKYIATKVRTLEPMAALTKMYQSINRSQLSKGLIHDGDVSWTVPVSKSHIIQIAGQNHVIRTLETVDRATFREEVLDPTNGDIKSNVTLHDYQDDIDSEIDSKGEHTISSPEEIPIKR